MIRAGSLFRPILIVLFALAFYASHGQKGEGRLAEANMPAGTPGPRMAFAQGPRVGQFLVASKTLRDPRFAETVVLLVQINEEGAMGVVINRPTGLKLSKVLDDMEGVEDRTDTLFFGGPVGINQIFLLLRTATTPKESKRILSDVYFSMSRDVVQRIIEQGTEAETVRFLAGYAGWGQGQLDQEILRGDWHVVPGDSETVFQMPPSEIWPALIRRSSYQWVMAVESGRGR